MHTAHTVTQNREAERKKKEMRGGGEGGTLREGEKEVETSTVEGVSGAWDPVGQGSDRTAEAAPPHCDPSASRGKGILSDFISIARGRGPTSTNPRWDPRVSDRDYMANIIFVGFGRLVRFWIKGGHFEEPNSIKFRSLNGLEAIDHHFELSPLLVTITGMISELENIDVRHTVLTLIYLSPEPKFTNSRVVSRRLYCGGPKSQGNLAPPCAAHVTRNMVVDSIEILSQYEIKFINYLNSKVVDVRFDLGTEKIRNNPLNETTFDARNRRAGSSRIGPGGNRWPSCDEVDHPTLKMGVDGCEGPSHVLIHITQLYGEVHH
ncbi:hypothetical protein Scep_019418 [Stephania cephalantha]|uniref:Uncharacterized protein n=1 Tax=Stephania cephalantha TaxID=152367 RepID=A0AAP0IAQ9_9MAGN